MNTRTDKRQKMAWVPHIAVLFCAAAVAGCSFAGAPTSIQAAPEAPAVPEASAVPAAEGQDMKSLPGTPEELWKRIMKLLAADGGYTPRQRVEEGLGIRFTHIEKDSEQRRLGAEYHYSFEHFSAALGLFKVGLFDDPKHTYLIVRWGRDRSEINCVPLADATQEVTALGWVTFGPEWFETGPSALWFYRPDELARAKAGGVRLDTARGDSKLILTLPYWGSQCVNSFSADAWRKHP